MKDYEKTIVDHYRSMASEAGLDESSTMKDTIVREKEIDAILQTLALISRGTKNGRIAEIGCGNGVLLEHLKKENYTNVVGMDYLPEFVALAKSRGLPYPVTQDDVRAMHYESGVFDVVIGERVIINLLDPADQACAFREVRRILRPNGYYLTIEAFEESLLLLNEARAEFGLTPIAMPHHNRWLTEEEWETWTRGSFRRIESFEGTPLTPRNFLSSHYFTSRVVYPLLTELRMQSSKERFAVKERNAHFSRFFGGVLPPHGNYASVQFLCLQAI